MENNLPSDYQSKLQQFDHAVFYCINSSSQRLPVGMIRGVSLLPDNTLEFSLSHFPVLENSWNMFAAELHFYKKGLPFNMNLYGTAWFVSQNDLAVQFRVIQAEYFWHPEVKPYSLHDSLAEILSSTGLFFKKMLVTGF